MAKKSPPTKARLNFESARLLALSGNYWPAMTRALLSLTAHETEEVPTAAVDIYWRLYYNPVWFASLTPQCGAAVLVHEVWHLLRFHGRRAKAIGVLPEEHLLWNLAADAEIHEEFKLINILKDMPPHSRPVTRSSFNPPLSENGTTEIWFLELKKRMEAAVANAMNLPGGKGSGGKSGIEVKSKGSGKSQQTQGDEEGDGSTGTSSGAAKPTKPARIPSSVLPVSGETGQGAYPNGEPNLQGSGVNGQQAKWELPSPDDGGPAGVTEDRAKLIQRDTAVRLQQQLSRGYQNGNILRWENEIIAPTVDWRTTLRNRFQCTIANVFGSNRWTYHKFSRRTPSDPRIIKPGRVGLIPAVSIIIDTSGSMSDKMLSACRQEVTSLLGSLGSRVSVDVYACDSKASEAQKVYTGATIQMFGGGGTDLREAFKSIEEKTASTHKAPDVIVVMTDGYTPWPKAGEVEVPTITILVGDSLSKIPGYPNWLDNHPNAVVKVALRP